MVEIDDHRYFRINVTFLEPSKINKDFSKRYNKELKSSEVYLGIRLNPTNLKQSAVLNSIDLGLQYLDLAKEELIKDYCEVSLFLREFHYSSDYMKSIVDTDSRTLMNFIQDYVHSDRLRYKSNQSILQKIRNVFTG